MLIDEVLRNRTWSECRACFEARYPRCSKGASNRPTIAVSPGEPPVTTASSSTSAYRVLLAVKTANRVTSLRPCRRCTGQSSATDVFNRVEEPVSRGRSSHPLPRCDPSNRWGHSGRSSSSGWYPTTIRAKTHSTFMAHGSAPLGNQQAGRRVLIVKPACGKFADDPNIIGIGILAARTTV